MANLMYGGTQEFDALAYGNKHPGTLTFLADQIDRLPQLSQTLSDSGRNFMANAAQLYQEFNSSEALRLARAAIRKAGNTFQSNTIRSIFDVAGIQHAPLVMQRYIMAQPQARQLFIEQRCDGYAETYVDMHPGDVGNDHYDYRRVMDGVLVDDEENDWKATLYYDVLLEGDRDLSPDEKVDIRSTWDIVQALMEAGEDDPTSPMAGKL